MPRSRAYVVTRTIIRGLFWLTCGVIVSLVASLDYLTLFGL